MELSARDIALAVDEPGQHELARRRLQRAGQRVQRCLDHAVCWMGHPGHPVGQRRQPAIGDQQAPAQRGQGHRTHGQGQRRAAQQRQHVGQAQCCTQRQPLMPDTPAAIADAAGKGHGQAEHQRGPDPSNRSTPARTAAMAPTAARPAPAAPARHRPPDTAGERATAHRPSRRCGGAKPSSTPGRPTGVQGPVREPSAPG